MNAKEHFPVQSRVPFVASQSREHPRTIAQNGHPAPRQWCGQTLAFAFLPFASGFAQVVINVYPWAFSNLLQCCDIITLL